MAKETRPLNQAELNEFYKATKKMLLNAKNAAEWRPAMTTLLEEVAEAILAARGKHGDSLELEITQIGGICINILWQLNCGQKQHVCNIGTKQRHWKEENNG